MRTNHQPTSRPLAIDMEAAMRAMAWRMYSWWGSRIGPSGLLPLGPTMGMSPNTGLSIHLASESLSYARPADTDGI